MPNIRIRDKPEEGAGPTLADKLYERLLGDIQAGRMEPGSKLVFSRLTTMYGASVSTAREALQRLSGEQMVVAEGHRGFRVAPLSLAELNDINSLRILLEPRALSQSIAHGDDAWEERIVLANLRMSRLTRPQDFRSQEADIWEHHHRDFHEALLSACPSAWTLHLCRKMYDQFIRYRRLILSQYVQSGRLRSTIDTEHHELMKYVLARDVDRAVSTLIAHYENTASRLVENYDLAIK